MSRRRGTRNSNPTAPFTGCQTHFAQSFSAGNAFLANAATLGLHVPNVRDELYWSFVETTAGVYDFSAFDAYVDAVAAAGVKLTFTADWSNTLYDPNTSRGGGQGFPDNATSIQKYGDYILATIAHYHGPSGRHPGIFAAVEIWNEFNGTWNGGYSGQAAAAPMTALLASVYPRIKAAYPTLTVLGGACVLAPLGYAQWLADAGALAYMDAFVVHLYMPPEDMVWYLGQLRAIFAAAGRPSLPIWSTEYSGNVTPDTTGVGVWTPRGFAGMRTAGVLQSSWYVGKNVTGFLSGLLNSAETALNPAGTSYIVWADRIRKSTPLGNVSTLPTTLLYRFAETNGNNLWVCWNGASTRTATITVSGAHTVKDHLGQALSTSSSYALTTQTLMIEGSAATVSESIGTDTYEASVMLDWGAPGSNWSWLSIEGLLGTPAALSPVVGIYDTSYGNATYAFLSIDRRNSHPSFAGGAVYAVSRWTAPSTGRRKVVLDYSRGAGGDGTDFSVRHNDTTVWARLPVAASTNATATIVLDLTSGDTLDFVVGPGAAGDVSFDSLRRDVTILRTSDATTAPDIVGQLPLTDFSPNGNAVQGFGNWRRYSIQHNILTPMPSFSAGTWTDPALTWAAVTGGSIHPGLINGNTQAPTVAEWTVPSTFTGLSVEIKGTLGRSAGGDGTCLAVSIARTTGSLDHLWSRTVTGSTAVDVVAAVAAGDRVRITAWAGPNGSVDVNFDSVSRLPTIYTSTASQTAPDVAVPVPNDYVLLAPFTDNGNATQGFGGWRRSTIQGDVLVAMPSFSSGTWSDPALTWAFVSATSMFPGLINGNTSVPTVAEWTVPSTVTSGVVRVNGPVGRSTGGDGTGVAVSVAHANGSIDHYWSRIVTASTAVDLVAAAVPGDRVRITAWAGASGSIDVGFDAVSTMPSVYVATGSASAPDVATPVPADLVLLAPFSDNGNATQGFDNWRRSTLRGGVITLMPSFSSGTWSDPALTWAAVTATSVMPGLFNGNTAVPVLVEWTVPSTVTSGVVRVKGTVGRSAGGDGTGVAVSVAHADGTLDHRWSRIVTGATAVDLTAPVTPGDRIRITVWPGASGSVNINFDAVSVMPSIYLATGSATAADVVATVPT